MVGMFLREFPTERIEYKSKETTHVKGKLLTEAGIQAAAPIPCIARNTMSIIISGHIAGQLRIRQLSEILCTCCESTPECKPDEP